MRQIIKRGAVGSRFHFFDDYKMNHMLEITSGVLAEKCGQKLSDFFKKRREQKKEEKREKISRLMLNRNLKLANQFQLNHVVLSIRWF